MSRGRKKRDTASAIIADIRRTRKRGINLLDKDRIQNVIRGDYCAESIVDETLVQPEIQALTSPDACAELRVVDSAIAVNMVLPPTTVMRSLKSVAGLAISRDVPVFLSKAMEMLIAELSLRAYLSLRSEGGKRARLMPNDITAGIAGCPSFDFLRDVLPQDELSTILAMHSTQLI